MNKFLTIGMATAALLGSTAALANHHAGGEPRGDVTRAEAQTKAAERFAKMDVNGDGQLSAADREAKRAERFAKTDTDGNGELSLAEMTAAREAHKAKRDERRAERGEGRAEAGERRGGRGEAGQRSGKRGQRGGERGQMAGRMMDRIDTDQSGTISQTEFTAAALARFDAADANSDGTVTADEHKAQRGERRGKMRERMQERRSQG